MFIINQCIFRQYNINSKWSVNVKVRTKIVQYQNIGVYFDDLGLDNGFLNITSEVKTTKEK